jgi:hypothetical protein
MGDDLGTWEPYGVERVAEVMDRLGARWWLSGGEALDRFVGRPTRPHGDLDVSIPTVDAAAVAERLAVDFEVRIASGGRLYRPGEPAPTTHNLWVRARTGGPWRWQVNAEPVDDTTWRYRRDPRVQRARDRAILDIGGLACVAPAVQLLWKAASPRERDEADRAVVFPLLPAGEREWLRGAIALAHPDSPWAE